MQAPKNPDNEAHRIATLRELRILDTPPEERFDRITSAAQRLFDVPIALVSLVDENRQWFKSCYGLSAAETPRDISFCGHAILGADVLVIEDALQDPRFADNPLVTGDPNIRFYAGCPLRANSGDALGTLCIIDRKPHLFDQRHRRTLRDLGCWAEQELNLLDLQTATNRALESEVRLRAIVDNVIDGIISFNAQGQIESVNSAALRLFGYSAAEMVGAPFLMLLSPEDGRKYQDYLREYLSSGQARILGSVVEATGRHQQGDTFPLEFAVSDLNFNGRHLFTAIVRDITERKKLDRLKNEFISTVSHELRTPLTSIRGALGLIAGGAVGEVPVKARELVDIACNNSDRLVRLINDILDIEKIESGRMKFCCEPLAMDAAARQAIEAVTDFGRQHGVDYVLDVTGETLIVKGDPDRMQQVLINLLSNAAKFSPAGAAVKVRVSRNTHWVRVDVADQGPGIDDEFKNRIFQKFAQADASDARQKGGTGLGLSICKAIVEQHGGTIGYTTATLAGTVFYFELPATQKA